MESTTKRQWHNVDIQGRWLLTYKVSNTLGVDAFGGKHLGLYESPFDGTTVYRRSVNDKPLNGFMMDKLGIQLYPDESLDHKYLINWLICHPEVLLEGVKDVPERVLKAKTGNKITLKCLDTFDLEKLDDEDFVDKVIGNIMEINIEKLRWILAAVDQPYVDSRFTGIPEKKALRSKLKSYTRTSIENAKAVKKAIEDLDTSKEYWLFKEMLKFKVLSEVGGQYKFNNVGVGSTYDRVQSFWMNNPEVKAEALALLAKKSK